MKLTGKIFLKGVNENVLGVNCLREGARQGGSLKDCSQGGRSGKMRFRGSLHRLGRQKGVALCVHCLGVIRFANPLPQALSDEKEGFV